MIDRRNKHRDTRDGAWLPWGHQVAGGGEERGLTWWRYGVMKVGKEIEMAYGDRYEVKTIFDMAKIPEDAQPRFLEELPTMLAEIRKVVLISDALEAAGITLDMENANPPVWIDDDKGESTLTMTDPDGDKVSITTRIKADKP